MPKTKTCLIFGGNGFIGVEVVRALLESQQEFDITIANRGRSWGWDTRDSIEPHVRSLRCDRKKPLSECPALVSYVEDQTSIDVVIDLSAYNAFAVEEATDLFEHTRVPVGIYIFISSDSVYEVCEKQHCGPSRETDAVRPSDPALRRRLKRHDSYGHKKLQCEEVVRRSKELPCIILRLADVIGQRDSTERWWQYQLWVKLAASCNIPIIVPEQLQKQQLSFVYVRDVAQQIKKLAEADVYRLGHLHHQGFNLAFADTRTVADLLEDIRVALHLAVPVLVEYRTEGAPHIFPSVDRGPIDISKAQSMLLWEPTPWKTAVQNIVHFYEDAAKSKQYKVKLKDCFESLLEDVEELMDTTLLKHKGRELLETTW